MRYIIGALLLCGVIWLVMFLGSLIGLIAVGALRIAIIFGIPTLTIYGIYKIFKR